MRYELFFLDYSGERNKPKIITKQFNAIDITVSSEGVWAKGAWASEDLRTPQRIFFPMHRIKYIKMVDKNEQKRRNSQELKADASNRQRV